MEEHERSDRAIDRAMERQSMGLSYDPVRTVLDRDTVALFELIAEHFEHRVYGHPVKVSARHDDLADRFIIEIQSTRPGRT